MPTYAYRCTECGEEFDIYQRFDEESLTNCPRCDAALRKLFSPTGIVFKGQGFYRTDSRSSTRRSTTTKAPSTTTKAPSTPSKAPSTPAKSD